MPLPELWVAGHSMGSAVGKLLAYAAQDYLNSQLGAEVGGQAGRAHQFSKLS